MHPSSVQTLTLHPELRVYDLQDPLLTCPSYVGEHFMSPAVCGRKPVLRGSEEQTTQQKCPGREALRNPIHRSLPFLEYLASKDSLFHKSVILETGRRLRGEAQG